jgi:hypothetical protein
MDPTVKRIIPETSIILSKVKEARVNTTSPYGKSKMVSNTAHFIREKKTSAKGVRMGKKAVRVFINRNGSL